MSERIPHANTNSTLDPEMMGAMNMLSAYMSQNSNDTQHSFD